MKDRTGKRRMLNVRTSILGSRPFSFLPKTLLLCAPTSYEEFRVGLVKPSLQS